MIEGLSLCSSDKEGRDSVLWDAEDGSFKGASEVGGVGGEGLVAGHQSGKAHQSQKQRHQDGEYFRRNFHFGIFSFLLPAREHFCFLMIDRSALWVPCRSEDSIAGGDEKVNRIQPPFNLKGS